MDFRDDQNDIERLCKKPWHTIWAVDSKNSSVTHEFLLKESLEKFPYILLITDCHNVWSQVSTSEMFTNQVQEILPGSIAPSPSQKLLLNLIREKLLETSTCYNNKPQFLVEFKDDSLLLSLDIVLSELSFVWLFHCVLWKQDCQLVLSELLVKPLLNTLKTLNDEKYALLDIVARKDKEISEYKNFFGTIPKVSVTTQPFSLEDFESTYLTEQHMSKNSNEVWMPHIRELFGSFISFGEDKKQRLSRLLGFETNEAIDSKDFHARNEVKVETKREKKDKRESSFVDEITRDSESEMQNQATQLTTRRKLLKTMSLEEKQKETPKKRKRLF